MTDAADVKVNYQALLANVIPNLTDDALALAVYFVANPEKIEGYDGICELIIARGAKGEDTRDLAKILGENVAFELILKTLKRTHTPPHSRIVTIDPVASASEPAPASLPAPAPAPAGHRIAPPRIDYLMVPTIFDKLTDLRETNKLKSPKISLVKEIPALSGRLEVKIKANSRRSRKPGALSVLYKTDLRWVWVGYIENGKFTPSRVRFHRDYLPHICDLIIDAERNFEREIVRSGKLTGQCCLCNRPLEDKRSLEAGYGPVCAKHYGLPW